MDWRHHEVRQSGICEVGVGDQTSLAAYEIGLVTTGRTRVFSGHFVRLTLNNGKQIIGEDMHSLRRALQQLADNIAQLGFDLNCAGLRTQFRESGLSMDTGWGYWSDQREPMHMMVAQPSEQEYHDEIDQVISEAVDAMQIGIAKNHPPA